MVRKLSRQGDKNRESPTKPELIVLERCKLACKQKNNEFDRW